MFSDDGSKYDMGYDTKTGEIYLWNKAGIVKIPTRSMEYVELDTRLVYFTL